MPGNRLLRAFQSIADGGLRVEATAIPTEDWDPFVAADDAGTAFHQSAWMIAVGNALGHPTIALTARGAAGELRGILPLARVQSRLFGDFLVSMPFASYGGPLGDRDACALLVAATGNLGRTLGCQLTELRSREPRPFSWALSTRKVTVLLTLPASTEELMQSFPSKLRSQIRRPMKEGVEVESGPHLLDAFFAVYSRHMRDLGTPHLPIGFFRELQSLFGKQMRLAVATLAGTPIAVGAGFQWGDEFEITWAASLREFNKYSPNMGVYFHLMDRAIASGASVFNFGRCSPDSNTHRFKRQWGGKDQVLHWYQERGDPHVIATPSAGGSYELAAKVWQQAPLAITRLLGPSIARLLP